MKFGFAVILNCDRSIMKRQIEYISSLMLFCIYLSAFDRDIEKIGQTSSELYFSYIDEKILPHVFGGRS